MDTFGTYFGELLRRLRTERRLSQQKLADKLHVDRSSVARWETGARLPDTTTVLRLSECLETDITTLLHAMKQVPEPLRVILVDDERIILNGEISVLKKTLPGAKIRGFTNSAEALAYVRENRVALAFLDIELVNASGLELCQELLAMDPQVRVVFLTAYPNYALDAWNTDADGFIVKPITQEDAERLLSRLQLVKGGAGI